MTRGQSCIELVSDNRCKWLFSLAVRYGRIDQQALQTGTAESRRTTEVMKRVMLMPLSLQQSKRVMSFFVLFFFRIKSEIPLLLNYRQIEHRDGVWRCIQGSLKQKRSSGILPYRVQVMFFAVSSHGPSEMPEACMCAGVDIYWIGQYRDMSATTFCSGCFPRGTFPCEHMISRKVSTKRVPASSTAHSHEVYHDHSYFRLYVHQRKHA